MKKIILSVSALAFMTSAEAQTKTKDASYTALPSGLSYKFSNDNKKTPVAKLGDFVEMHISFKVGDSTFYNSKTVNDNKPVQFQVQPAPFKGELSEGFLMMSAGDIAQFKVPVDSILKTGMHPAEWMKPGVGQTLDYNVEMISVTSQEAMKAKNEAQAAKQKEVDEKLLLDYFTKNKIKAQKTASGLYYIITQKGNGENAKAGQQVTVNYTGKTMNGNKFDSNVDSAFGHVQPFTFGLGQGQVIKGWDEGIALLNKGAKGTLFIPSTMAYGENSPTPAIPPHSVLIFDVELLNMAQSTIPAGHSEHDGHNH